MKLLITGGHVTPALACIDYIQQQKSSIDILFVGRKYAQAGDKTVSFEYQEVSKRNIPFIPLNAGRLTRVASLRSFLNVLQVPIGFMQAWMILAKKKPDAILSFGGYIALPIAIIASMLKIPVYTHEQTINPGLANKLIARVSKKVFISFPETKIYFQKGKTIFTGNPVRPQVFTILKKSVSIDEKKPVIYVTGGSLGAHSVNVHIEAILPELLKNYVVIHQIGDVKETGDYDRLVKLKSSLPKELQHSYIPLKHVRDDEIGYIYSLADIVIGRAGANTFFELVALEKPAIFIPLPWSANGEQAAHAQLFVDNHVGEVFDQYKPSEVLLKLIEHVMNNISTYQDNFINVRSLYERNAEKTIISHILKT